MMHLPLQIPMKVVRAFDRDDSSKMLSSEQFLDSEHGKLSCPAAISSTMDAWPESPGLLEINRG